MEIFAISPQKITTLVKKNKHGESIYKERRRGLKTYKFTANDRPLVKEHIDSFPRDVDHYNRNRSENEYLSGDLILNRPFQSFIEKYPNTSKCCRSVFLKDFPNLSFHRTLVDTCKTCDRLNIAKKSLLNRIAQAKTILEFELHHRQVDSVFTSIKNLLY